MIRATNNPVGRPRSFDEAETLEAVIALFWRKGFEGTSMADLMAVTGLHKGSLYQAFGDKHALFTKSLRQYIARLAERMRACLNEPDRAIDGLREAMYCNIELGLNDDGSNNGCMALNSLVEDGPGDPVVLGILKQAFEMRIQLITEAVGRAQSEGDMRSDMPKERLAYLLATFEAGLLVELKGPLDEPSAKALVDDYLASLA